MDTTYRVKADNLAPRVSRSFLNGMRAELEPRFDDVAIVVSELVSNSVRHGENEVTLKLATEPDKIRIEVVDHGPCFDQDAPRGNGMGLHIVNKIASDWGVRIDGGCTVWVVIPKHR